MSITGKKKTGGVGEEKRAGDSEMNAEEQKLYPEMLNCYFDALICRFVLWNSREPKQERLH